MGAGYVSSKHPTRPGVKTYTVCKECAARKLIEIASGVEAVQDGRIHIENNGPFLFEIKGTPAPYQAGLKHAIQRGWIVLRASGTFIRFTQGVQTCLSSRAPKQAARDRRLRRRGT